MTYYLSPYVTYLDPLTWTFTPSPTTSPLPLDPSTHSLPFPHPHHAYLSLNGQRYPFPATHHDILRHSPELHVIVLGTPPPPPSKLKKAAVDILFNDVDEEILVDNTVQHDYSLDHIYQAMRANDAITPVFRVT